MRWNGGDDSLGSGWEQASAINPASTSPVIFVSTGGVWRFGLGVLA
jgi:hypothetical protein